MRIAAWGDSITYGSCDPEALGWVGRLRKERSTATEQCSVYNRGISGDTSRGLLTRLPVELASLHPDITIISIGVNDTVYREGDMRLTETPIDEFEDTIRKIISLAKSQPAQVYVVGLGNVIDELLQPYPWSNSGKCYANAVIETFDKVLRDISKELEVPFIPIFGELTAHDFTDGIHPNAKGYDKLAAKIGSSIR